MRRELAKVVEELISLYQEKHEFKPGKTPVRLMEPTFGVREISEVMDCLISTNVTMGNKVRKFENAFASYIGTSHGIMVNSGSSANLLLLSALRNKRLNAGDEIITPAVTWSTSVFPIYQVGCIPCFIDIDPETLTPLIQDIEGCISNKTRAIMHVHLLGSPTNMDKLTKIASDHKLTLIEDACEAHGAKWKNKRIGSFGIASTFSFFFSHHISTIEGGMILTNDNELADILRSKRAHGWIRERSDNKKISSKYSDIDPRFLFVTDGYNLRPTDLQGAIGMHQIDRLDGFLKARRKNAEFWNRTLRKYSHLVYVPKVEEGGEHAWFGYPIILRPESNMSRKKLVAFLEKRKIETRPIMGGNITVQPALATLPYRKCSALTNAQIVDRNGIFIGNHSAIGLREREYVSKALEDFFKVS